MNWIPWIANVLIVIGLWAIGNKRRYAFLFSIAGETLWMTYSVLTGMYSLAFICAVFVVLASRNYIKWGRK